MVSEGADAGRDRIYPPGGESRRSRPIFEPSTEDSYNYRFAAGKAFTEKFERLAEVIGIEYPNKHMEEVFELALDIALEKRDPRRKLDRRLKREARNNKDETPHSREETEEGTSDASGGNWGIFATPPPPTQGAEKSPNR